MEKKSPMNADEYSDAESTTKTTRTLHVQFDNWMWRHASIFDSDEKTPLYRVECHLRNPKLILHLVPGHNSSASSTRSTVTTGEASFHYLKNHIGIKLVHDSIKLTSRGTFKDGYTYPSPTRHGATMTWQSKSRGKYFDMVCLDETAMPVARVSLAMCKVKNAVKFELVSEDVMREGTARDEMVMTGLAVLQQRLCNWSATYGASSVAVA